jgi:hypothetical protein
MDAKTYVVPVTAVPLVFLSPYPNFPATANTQLKTIESRAESFVKYHGRFHPPVVHFPVAFTLGALLTEPLFLVTRRSSFARGSRLMVYPGLAR